MIKQKIKVWDVPTRLFHWSLVLSIVFMWYSANVGGNLLIWHLRCGLLILGLIVFRLCWGLWGSDTARFRHFVRGPKYIIRYIKGEISENEQPGHNPLGALMVLALIGAVSVQVLTGLFAADEDTFINNGFLNHLVSSDMGSLMHKIHVGFFNLLAGLALIHIVTVYFYKLVKKHDLIKPMFTGSKELLGQIPNLKFAGIGQLLAALIVAGVAIALVLGLA